VPLVWCVSEHHRAAVAYEQYQGLLEKAAPLVPLAGKVVWLADRGFAETELMHHLKRLGWHFRIRIKANCWLYRPGHGGLQVRASSRAPGQTRCWPGVLLTTKRVGPVHRAVAWPWGRAE
jgi:hypothetical protein